MAKHTRAADDEALDFTYSLRPHPWIPDVNRELAEVGAMFAVFLALTEPRRS